MSKKNNDINERRQQAELALVKQVSRIADDYDLCPVCLMVALATRLKESVISGDLWHLDDRHAGDEGFDQLNH